MARSQKWTGWVDRIAPDEWRTYERILKEAARCGIRFALGGGFATATHTGRWRDTNDMDVYIMAQDRERAVRLVEQLGLVDVHDQIPYDPSWTYRATDGKVIVEMIWTMRNHRARVDPLWFEKSIEVEIRGMKMLVAPPEEIIWPKLYVMMKERCDWPDILNYFYYCADGLDWRHLLDRLGEDKALLAAVLILFAWVSPDRILNVPEWVWMDLTFRIPGGGTAEDGLRHANLLSTMNWYAAMAEGSTLEKSK